MRTGALFVALVAGACASRPVVAPSPLAAVRHECQQLVASGQLPSIAIAVSQGGRVVWEEAFGQADIENGRPATTNTMYTLVSTGKSITGTAVLVAAAQGLIDLDAPMSGEVRTWEGATPVQITFASNDTATMSVAASPQVAMTKLDVEIGAVRGRCACTVPLSDTHGEPSELDLQLRRDGDRLYGSATLISTGPRTNFSFPAHVILRRLAPGRGAQPVTERIAGVPNCSDRHPLSPVRKFAYIRRSHLGDA